MERSVVDVPGLAAGARADLTRMLEGSAASAGCADRDCAVAVRADESGEVAEWDESNYVATAIALEDR